MIDRLIKVSSIADATTRLRGAGIGEMLAKDDAGDDVIVTASHDVAVKVFDDLLTVRGTYDRDGNELTPPVFDGPHLMVRLLSERAEAKDARLDDRPALEVVANSGTVGWFGG